MHAFQKEQRLQTHVIGRMLGEAGEPDFNKLEVARYVVAQAHTTFFDSRFGSFQSFGDTGISAIYSNMGPSNLWVLNACIALMEHVGLEVIAVACLGEDDRELVYSWALLLPDPDGAKWAQILRDIYVEGIEQCGHE